MEGSAERDDSGGSTKAKARYDDLTAAQVIKQLPRLPTDALERVRSHEQGNKGRATVLRAIDALLSARPTGARDDGDALIDLTASDALSASRADTELLSSEGTDRSTRCPGCGSPVVGSAKFCPDCGTPLANVVPKASVTTPAPAPAVQPPITGVQPSGTSWGPSAATLTKKKRMLPDWRPLTWVIVVLNILFLIWVIAAIASAAHNNAASCANDTIIGQEACTNASDAGTAIGVGIVIFFWAAVDAILGVIWLVTRSRGRTCPVCGSNVKRGYTQCRSCGYDYRQTAGATRPR